MGKFRIRKVASGIKFDLLAANGRTVLSSEVYATRAAALKGITSIRLNAPDAPVEVLTEEGHKSERNPKFEVFLDKAEEYRFRMKARNGKIVGTSEGYATLAGCLNGIDSVKINAAEAETEL